jgi:hypothetical protein
MKMINLIFVISITLIACNNNDCDLPDDLNSGIIVSSFEVTNECVRLDEYKDTYIIRTLQEYDSIKIKESYVDTCTVFKLNSVDFEKHTLLGFQVCGTCQVSYDRKVSEDIKNKKYIYSININECGDCKKLNCSMNWVLVPKLPDDWTVEFIEE